MPYWGHMHHLHVLHTIGRTPMVELKHLSPRPEVRLFAKLEGWNPTGSIKDRIVKHMIQHAERDGMIIPGDTVVEASTGNTGIALAMIGRAMGYKTRVVMPENVYPEIPRTLGVYGAEVHWVPAADGVTGAMAVARQMARDEHAFFLDQFGNAHNARAHYVWTGQEILEDVPDVDIFIAGLGTGGTLMGAGDRLRESFPDVVVAAAEPLPGDPVMGLRSLEDGYIPPILDVSKLDRKMLVSNADSVLGVRALLEREGIFAGVSCGAAIHVARKIALELDEGSVVVVILADAGWKYISADFWETEEVEQSMESTVWW